VTGVAPRSVPRLAPISAEAVSPRATESWPTRCGKR
jgi:hypothetical protein